MGGRLYAKRWRGGVNAELSVRKIQEYAEAQLMLGPITADVRFAKSGSAVCEHRGLADAAESALRDAKVAVRAARRERQILTARSVTAALR